MNQFIAWFIIWIGVITGGYFWLSWFSSLGTIDLIKTLTIIPLILLVAGAIGFATVFLIERSTVYSIHAAILLPWAPVLIIIATLLKPDKLFPIDVDTQLTLVFASTGGVIAHNRRVKKKFSAFLNS